MKLKLLKKFEEYSAMIETNITTLNVDEIMAQSKDEAEKYNIGSAVTAEFELPSQNIFIIKECYEIDDFLQYYDINFLENLYLGILGREPDDQGMQNNLKLLHSGKLTRTEILLSFYLSEEGKANNITINGLKSNHSKGFLYRIPIIRSILNFFNMLFTLEKRIKRLEAQMGKLYYQDTILKDIVNQKSDRSATEYLRLQLKTKADLADLHQNI